MQTGYLLALAKDIARLTRAWRVWWLVRHGFSSHGFKLSPAVGRVLAQEALGLPTDVPLAPYALERFCRGRLLTGRFAVGAVS